MSNLVQILSLDRTQKQYIGNLLDNLIEHLDLTETQYKRIKQAYNGVGTYLAESYESILKGAVIYSQGSVRLNTTVKPKGSDQYDVDLICYLPNAGAASGWEILETIRKRLDNHGTYREMLSPLPRGFRIKYAGEYHLDITPGVDWSFNPSEENHPLWVTDVNNEWKESNPAGYATWFDKVTEKKPRYNLFKVAANESYSVADSVRPLPDHTQKKLLNRIVQICKRHRDVWALEKGRKYVDFKPISAIITTLAAHAYSKICDERRTYDTNLDVIIDVLTLMPSFIKLEGGIYQVLNPSMVEENFAEKWNIKEDRKGERLRNCFFQWYQAALLSFTEIGSSDGEDQLLESLSKSFGKNPIQAIHKAMVHRISNARSENNLSVLTGTGALIIGQTANSASSLQSVPSNTFYGSSAVTPVTIRKNTFFGS